MSKRSSLGFSTMGDPSLSLGEACELLEKFNLSSLEIRALNGSLDLPGYFRTHGYPAVAPPVSLIATSLSLLDAPPDALDEFYAYAEVAHHLGARYLRVFGQTSGPFGELPSRSNLKAAANLVKKIRKTIARFRWKSELLLETHDVFSSSERCLELNTHLEVPLNILWDSHHTWRLAGESPGSTWRMLGPLIKHVHYKDSVFAAVEEHGYRYVLPGKGEFPSTTLYRLLRRNGYSGVISLEWEKLWHPRLAPLKRVLAAFTKVFPTETPPTRPSKRTLVG